MRRGFTLLEMLLVLAIIFVLMGTGLAGYSHMVAAAERQKAQELVSNAATALAAIFTEDGVWPKALSSKGGGEGQLDADAAWVLYKKNKMSLYTNYDKEKGQPATKLAGRDRFGLVTPWALHILQTKGSKATLSTKVSPGTTVQDHILYFALDLDGDGIVTAKVGGEDVRIRTAAAVWCIGKSGGTGGKPWPYSKGLKRDDVYSWVVGQTKKVN